MNPLIVFTPKEKKAIKNNNYMEAIEFLKTNHFSTFIKTRQDVETILSNSQSMFCVCGKLATGFHESKCRKFQKKVDKETVKQLKHLVTR